MWDPTAVGDIQKIEDVQRHFTARISCCHNVDYWDRLKMLNLHSLQRRRERYSIIHMWKILNNLTPNDLNIEFINNERMGMRAKVPPMVRGATPAAQTARDNSFRVRAAKLWNILPPAVTRIEKLETFKAELGNFLKRFPDQPPIAGHTCSNNNSLLAWSQEGIRWTPMAR